MKKVLLLFVLFLVLVVALAPARIIHWFMPEQSPVILQGVSGSIWSPEITKLNYKQMNFEDVKLTPSLLSLMIAELNINFDILKGDIAGTGDLIVSENSDKDLSIKNGNLQTSAKYLNDLIKIPGLKIDGNAKTSDLNLTLENKKLIYVDGKLSWFNSQIDFFGRSFSLGDFILGLTTHEETKIISGELEKSKNELGLQGKFSLDPQGAFEFIGSISKDIDKELYSTISLFADGQLSNGRLPIKYKQKVF